MGVLIKRLRNLCSIHKMVLPTCQLFNDKPNRSYQIASCACQLRPVHFMCVVPSQTCGFLNWWEIAIVATQSVAVRAAIEGLGASRGKLKRGKVPYSRSLLWMPSTIWSDQMASSLQTRPFGLIKSLMAFTAIENANLSSYFGTSLQRISNAFKIKRWKRLT